MLRKSLLLFFTCLICSGAWTQENLWKDVSEASIPAIASDRQIIPNKYRAVELDTTGLLRLTKTAPREFTPAARLNPVFINIPMPYGGTQKFTIVLTEVMEPGLAAKFPGIKVFGGQGVDDPSATIKIDWTPRGFHAQVLSPSGGSFYIDPYATGTLLHYISYYKKDLTPRSFTEEEDPTGFNKTLVNEKAEAFNGCVGDTLRRYRLAVGCTGEYGVAVGATTLAQGLAAVITSVNRVNGVYETELAIRLVLVDNEDKLVFIDPATDPFTQNNNSSGLLAESIKVCDSIIGNANYDIGHTFSTGAGGVAGLRVICTTNKARGVTGITHPVGDAYDIDYVAHEMGHQFGGNHTFNAITGSCNGNRSAAANAEPGSATTIMGYAGICGLNDLQPHSDPYFHPVSYNEITNYTINGVGNSCPVKLLTGNISPVVNAGLDYTIPKSTPFILTGSGTDADGDNLVFAWDEVDVGGPAGNWNVPVGNAPLFRFFPPTPIAIRYFPKLSDVINNTTTIGEILPNYGRNINFRLSARDNRSGGGGLCWDQSVVTVNGNSGPFIITAPNTTKAYNVATFMHVKWNVANTNIAPVSCDSVAIELSTDGGLTFPITLMSQTKNDGDEDVIVPNNATTTARVRIRALKNVFYDMSDSNFTIATSSASEFVFNDPEIVINCDGVNPSLQLRTASLNGFTSSITLSATGNPAGTGVAFSANPITPGSSVKVTLLGTLLPGNYSITVTGTAGSVVKSKVIQFTIGTPTLAPVQSSPSNSAAGQSFTPTLTWQPVSGALAYNLLVSSTNAFADTIVSATNLVGTSYSFTTPLIQNTLYFWRVSALNSCGAGRNSGAFQFRTGFVICSDTLRSPNVPVTIPLAATTVTSTLNIPAGGTIADVDVVGLRGLHTYVSDLSFNLKSPAGTNVLLFGGVCTSLDNFDINLDDEAASATITCPPTGGQVRRPAEALSRFDNETSTGTWTLSVSDADPADGGSLTGWGLRICTYSTSALPVNWLSFTGRKIGTNSIQLNWVTANELKNDHYELERSADGLTFGTIGNVEAGRNINMTQQYLYTDLKPFSGVNYYRLKQVDKDGNYTYSAIVKVVMDKGQLLWTLYPNPAKDFTILRALSDLGTVQVTLTDASGKLVRSLYRAAIKTGESINIPLNTLSKGMYLVKIESDKEVKTEKIVVE